MNLCEISGVFVKSTLPTELPGHSKKIKSENIGKSLKFNLKESVKKEKTTDFETAPEMEEDQEEMETYEEPREITELLTCPLCFKKYATESDMENHIAIFHHIPKKVQRQSLQGGNNSLFIIKETVAVKDED